MSKSVGKQLHREILHDLTPVDGPRFSFDQPPGSDAAVDNYAVVTDLHGNGVRKYDGGAVLVEQWR